MIIQKTVRTFLCGAGLMALALLAGCASKEQKALNQAKTQATSTNVPQQVQYIDSSGNTVTKTIEPPAAQGQQPAVSTLITPPPPGPKPHSTDPVITPLNSAAQGTAPMNANGQPASTGGPAAGPPPASQPGQPPAVSISVPAGTELAIRIDQRLSARTSYSGEHFNGNVVDPVLSNGTVIIPRGTPVSGRVVEAHHGGHFRGRSVLELRLTAMTLNGYEYPLDTHDTVRSRRGKGRRSAGIIGGMTGAGMLIGGIASGGVGLAIGAAAGAGSGTAIAGGTGNHNLDIPAESIVHFRLADPLVVQNP
jgi:outer membrane murein-binding lipoprotein Lpp